MVRSPVCVCASAKTAAASGEHPHKPAISAHGAVRQPLNEAPSAILARQKMLSTIGGAACTCSSAAPQAARGGQQDDQPSAVHREGLALESQPPCSLPFVLGVCCQRAAVTPAEARACPRWSSPKKVAGRCCPRPASHWRGVMGTETAVSCVQGSCYNLEQGLTYHGPVARDSPAQQTTRTRWPVSACSRYGLGPDGRRTRSGHNGQAGGAQ
jgi:hypothetical protein